MSPGLSAAPLAPPAPPASPASLTAKALAQRPLLRPGRLNGVRNLSLEALEIVLEHLSELRGFAVERIAVGPGAAGLEYIVRNAADVLGNVQAENGVDARGDVIEQAAQCGVHHCACIPELHPRADAVRAAGPAGVDQPALRVVLLQLFAEEPGVDGGREWDERLGEAGAERGLRLGDAALGARNFGGVSREEMVHRLF